MKCIGQGMAEQLLRPYRYDDLPAQTSFRVAELLPGKGDDPVSCKLHVVQWSKPIKYEAVSYAWGDPKATAVIICDGKRLEVTQNLRVGLVNLRFQDRSRLLWADALW